MPIASRLINGDDAVGIEVRRADGINQPANSIGRPCTPVADFGQSAETCRPMAVKFIDENVDEGSHRLVRR